MKNKKLVKLLSSVLAFVFITGLCSSAFAIDGSIKENLPVGTSINGINGWTISGASNGDSASIAANPDAAKGNAIKFTVDNANSVAVLSKAVEETDGGTVLVSMDINAKDAANSRINVIVRNTDSTNNMLASLDLKLGKTVINNTAVEDRYPTNKTFRLSVLIDAVGKSVEYYIDGVKEAKTTTIDKGNLKVGSIEIKEVVAENNGSGSWYFDNITVAKKNTVMTDSANPADWETTKFNDIFSKFGLEDGADLDGNQNWRIANSNETDTNLTTAKIYSDVYMNVNSDSNLAKSDSQYLMIRKSTASESYKRRVYKTLVSGDSIDNLNTGKFLVTAKINVHNGTGVKLFEVRDKKDEENIIGSINDPGRQIAQVRFEPTDTGSGTGKITYGYHELTTEWQNAGTDKTVEIGTYSYGSWMDIAVIIDIESRTYQIYKDNILLAENVPFYYSEKRSATANNISYVSLELPQQSSNGRMYVDSVAMYADEKLLENNYTTVYTDNIDEHIVIDVFGGISYDETNKKVTITKNTATLYDDTKLFVASYGENQSLIDVAMFDISEQAKEAKGYTLESDFEFGSTLRAFVWKDKVMVPLVGSVDLISQ